MQAAQMMRPRTTAFFDVDTQHDFIMPGGKLCIAGTERIVPALGELTTLARRLGIRMFGSVDRHFPEDPELARNGGQYPDHCMDGTPGQRKIAVTAPANPLFLENRDHPAERLAAALTHPGELIFEKQLFDVFTGNRHTERLLREALSRYNDLVVYGVYTEVCVADAVRGLLRMGPRLHVVTDAIADLSDAGPRYRAEWQATGIRLLTLAELTAELS